MDRLKEIYTKHERIREYLHIHNLDGVLLSSVANFAWFTGGGDSHVENHNKFGIASILVTENKKYIITNNIEADRLLYEQLENVGTEFNFEVYDWYDSSGDQKILDKLIKGKKVAADSPKRGLQLLDGEFSELRFVLTENEVERFRWLGLESRIAVEKAAHEILPGMSEHEIEALMAYKLRLRSIQPVVILVAADNRNDLYRHPVPTNTKVTKFAKLVCCARKWGLIVSLTRSVHLGAIPGELRQKQEAVVYVDSVFIAETKPGVKIGKIIDLAKDAYKEKGYPCEWQHHHQGGPIGYETRDFIGISEENRRVMNLQAFAWNPSIVGNKSEDSFITSTSGTEMITMSNDWPLMDVKYKGNIYQRPDILVI